MCYIAVSLACLKMVVSVPTMLLSLLLLLLMAMAAVSSDSADPTVFTITPNKTSSDCQPPGEECTLEQFQEQYMSGELNISANTTLDFLPGTHLLDSHLKVNDTDKFVMQAMSNGSNVNITCTKSASFDFVNITLLEVDQIMFFGCGSRAIGWGNSAAIKIANVSEVWLSNITILHSRGSAIAAIHSSLTISDTSISNSSGSGLIVDSCAKVTFLSGLVQFSNNSTPYSGGAIQANNSNISTSDKVKLKFIDNVAEYNGGAIYLNVSSVTIFGVCAFTGNTAVSRHGGAIFANGSGIESVIMKGTATFENNKAECNGGAIHTNQTKLEIVGTEDISFIQNRGGFKGGAICAWHSNYTSLSGNIKFSSNFARVGGGAIDVEVTKAIQLSGTLVFEDNFAVLYGGAIELLGTHNVTISGNINFTKNSAQLGGAIFVLVVWDTMQFGGNIMFVNNSAGRGSEEQGIGGALMVVYANTVSFVVNGSTIFEGNSAHIGGAIANINVYEIEVIGSSSKEILFHNNNASNYGGAMYMDSSTIRLQKNVKFVKNSAYEGGGLYLNEKSNCSLGNGVQVLFHENYAVMKGGGIFISSSDHVTTCLAPSEQLNNVDESYIGTECTIQWIQGKDVSLHFVNNTAGGAGYALYGGSIDICRNRSSFTTVNFTEIIKIEQGHESNVSNISSDPYKVCKCSPNGTICEGTELHLPKYPGQNFTLHVLAFGQRNGTVPATIVVPKASWTDFSIFNYHPQDTDASCSKLKYAILPQSKEIHSVKFELKPEGNCIALSKGLKVNITIKECPAAFHFSSTMGCECAHELKGYTDKCSIDNQTIFCSKDKKFWVGVDGNSSLVLYPHCPFDYCKPSDIWIPVNDTDEQCNNNRMGLLCGKCKSNFSLMLGSSACTDNCSNLLFLYPILAFAIAGLALVVFLFALKLTVAEGTINGLVFYANIIHINQTLFFSSKNSFLTVFIAWINLDLGIPTCFYRGMDMYAKTWLQYVFPVYIWVLCGSIIILSRKSTNLLRLLGKNPVAVLSTLFLLSYTKLVRVVITALFSFTAIEYPNGHSKIVWLYDANVSNAKHTPLIIVSVLMFFLLFPYTVLLFASQWFQWWSNYRLFSWMNSPRVKYFLDTYHAPFKPKHRYWTGLLLIVRVVLQLVINNVYSPVNSTLVLCVIISLLIMWQAVVGNSYSHQFHGILEVSLLVNLEILAAASLYCYAVESCDRTAIAQTSAALAFVAFVIILFYHLHSQLKKSRLWHRANWFQFINLRTHTDDEAETALIQDSFRISSHSVWMNQ